MKGRKPKTAELVLLEGNRGRRPDKTKSIAGVRGIPRRPAWLSSDARAFWDDAIRYLDNQMQVLTEGDQAMLAMFCQASADFAAITEQLRAYGRLYRTTTTAGDTVIKTSPLVAQQNELRRQIRLLAAELGLSPVARVRAAQAGGARGGEDGRPKTIGEFLGRSS